MIQGRQSRQGSMKPDETRSRPIIIAEPHIG
jgi:hypothetical protein